jgi:hypothetical protein
MFKIFRRTFRVKKKKLKKKKRIDESTEGCIACVEAI